MVQGNEHSDHVQHALGKVDMSSVSLPCHHARMKCASLVLCLITIMLCSVALGQHERPSVTPGSVRKDDTMAPIPNLLLATDDQVVSQYSFQPLNLVLLLHDDGHLSAHDLWNGRKYWSTDIGGALYTVRVAHPPSREAVAVDPLALPFAIHGNGLFTHIPVATEEGDSSILKETQGLPHALRSHFFMNFSSLIRRQAILSGGTDIYVTSSVDILDMDSSNGRVLGEGGKMDAGMEGGTPADVPTLPEKNRRWREDSSLLTSPLHAVRYNIVIHAFKPGEYEWSIKLSKVQLSVRDSLHTHVRQGMRPPRFFSRLVKDMMDEEYVSTFLLHRQRPSMATGGGTDAVSAISTVHTGAASEAVRNGKALFVLREVNSSHVALWSLPNQLEMWYAAVTQDATSGIYGHHKDDGHDGVASAFVWLAGSHDVMPISVSRVHLPDHSAAGSRKHMLCTQSRYPMLSNTSQSANFRLVAPPTRDDGTPLYYNGRYADLTDEASEGIELEEYYRQCMRRDSPSFFYPHTLASSSEGAGLEVHMSTGLPWTIALSIAFHVGCLASSIGFLCAGIPPRGRLQRAWAQADRNRDVRQALSAHTTIQRLTTLDIPGDSLGSTPLLPHTGKLGLPSTPPGPPETLVLPCPRASVATSGVRSVACSTDNVGEDGRHTTCPGEEHTSENGSFQLLPSSAPPKATDKKPIAVTDGEGASSRANGYGTHYNVNGTEADSSRNFHPLGVVRTNTEDLSNPDINDADDSQSDDTGQGHKWWLHLSPVTSSGQCNVEESVMDFHSSSASSPAHAGRHRSDAKLFQLHFMILEKIGFGAEGSVFRVEHRVTHTKYAIKVVRIHEQEEERVVQEAVLHSSFDHFNVVRFFFCWIEDVPVATADSLRLLDRDDGMDTWSISNGEDSLLPHTMSTSSDRSTTSREGTYRMLFIQMEYFPRGTLADLLLRRSEIDRATNLRHIKEIANGLAYLHNQDVLHRDLKPTNIFVSNEDVMKIGDFGLAKRRGGTAVGAVDLAPNVVGTHQEHSLVGGSPLYCSPEQMHGDVVNKSTDIFSFGMIALEMYCSFRTLHERIRILTDARQQVLPVELKKEFPEEMKFIESMLDPTPARRPSIRKAIKSISKLILSLREDTDESDTAPPSSMIQRLGKHRGQGDREIPFKIPSDSNSFAPTHGGAHLTPTSESGFHAPLAMSCSIADDRGTEAVSLVEKHGHCAFPLAPPIESVSAADRIASLDVACNREEADQHNGGLRKKLLTSGSHNHADELKSFPGETPVTALENKGEGPHCGTSGALAVFDDSHESLNLLLQY